MAVPPAHDKGVIEAIAPRTREFVRKDPTERAVPQVLAANFERVIVAQPVGEVNLRRLERELVLAFETGAEVTVVLTKADLADDAATRATVEAVQALLLPRPMCSSCPRTTRHRWRPCARFWRRAPPRCSSGARGWGSPAW